MGLETVSLAVVPSQRLARASRVPLSDGTVPWCAPVPVFLFVALWKPLHSSCRRETGSLNPPADG